MYNLIVSVEAKERSRGDFTMERPRFLEYTDERIARDIGTLSNEAVTSIRSWPCVFIQEGRGDETVTLARLTRLELHRGKLLYSLEPLDDSFGLANDDLWRLSSQLDIGDFEFTRNHWAIKDRNLFSVLASIRPSVAPTFVELPLPSPTRRELLDARDAISSLGHTEIDDLLLEVGIDDLKAGRELGSIRNRANAIVKFAIEQPTAITAENDLLSAYLVRRKESGEKGLSVATSLSATTDEPLDRVESLVPKTTRGGKKVFVVHGQNEPTRQQLVEFLQSLELEPIVLHEQANMGRHLLTKFIQEAALVTFAVVLMTDDDEGARKGAKPQPRARQNVILELGYFLAHLTQPRVCALITPGLETPSDFDGIVYIRMSADRAWQTELKRELVAAKMLAE